MTIKTKGDNPLPQKTNRAIDANLNRLREGLRVIEDIQRYLYDNKEFALRLKNLRHECKTDNQKDLLKTRDIINDPLKETTKSESTRKNIEEIIIANFKRTQESARVLEEMFKLTNKKESEKFKQIRYSLYDIEKSLILE